MFRYRSLALIAAASIVSILTLSAQTATPPQPRQLKANGTDLTYIEQGSGTPVVFVHGAVSDLRFWEPQVEAIARRHRFIAYTYRYHGTAPWPDAGQQYSAATHAADLAAFLAGLNAGPVHLVGLSYGGMVAAIVATKEPKLIRTLTLAEPALFGVLAEFPDGKPALESWSKGAAPIGEALKRNDTTGAVRVLAGFVNNDPAAFDKLSPAQRQVLLDNARTMALLFAAPAEAMPCERLKTIDVPTLIIRGENTALVFSKTNEVVGRCIAGSQQVVVPKAAHTMSADNPATFNQTLLQFLQKHRGTN